MAYNYSEGEIKERVIAALGMLKKNDSTLLELKVNERAIAHKLAEYLHIQFPDWNADCDYNRKGTDLKRLRDIEKMPECNQHRRTNRICPDIIIHLRKQDLRNLLVVELKKEGLDSACDIKKLKLLTAPTGDYCYFLGVFIQFSNTGSVLRWFKEGVEIT